MQYSIHIQSKGTILRVKVPYELKELAKGIPGWDWKPQLKIWEYPASPRMMSLLEAKFGFCTVTGDAAYQRLKTMLPPELSQSILKFPLWKHQEAGAQFILDRYNAGMLGMGMGTGKTLTIISLLHTTGADTTIIQCPHSVCKVWRGEFQKHAAGHFYPVVIDSGTLDKRLKDAKKGLEIAKAHGLPFVLIVNYESAWREPLSTWILKNFIAKIDDESHRVKAPGGKASKFGQQLGRRTELKIAATGTPLHHTPFDIYAQARAIDETVYGTSAVLFRNKFFRMGGFQNKQIQGMYKETYDEFQELFHEFAFIVGDEVLDLPPITTTYRTCQLSKKAWRVYKEMENDFYSRIDKGEIYASNALVKSLRLRQIAGGVVETEERAKGKKTILHHERICTAKKDLLQDHLEDIPLDEPVGVCCSFKKDIEAVEEVSVKTKRPYGEVSGKRKDLTDDGKMPEDVNLMAVQQKSGGVGIDLTRSAYPVMYSPGYSLGDYDQFIKRFHRPGQSKHVHVTHLVAEGTIDETIYTAIEERRDVAEAIMNRRSNL